MSNTDSQPAIQVQVTPDGVIRRFDSISALSEWLAGELVNWRWLQDVRNRMPTLKPVMISQVAFLTEQQGALAAFAAGTADEQQRRAQAIQVATSISARVRERTLTLSEDPRGAFVLKVRDEHSPIVAAFSLTYFNRVGIPPDAESSTDGFEGRFRAVAFDTGLHQTAESERTALASLRDEFAAGVVQQREQSTAHNAELAALHRASTDDREQRRNEWEAVTKERASEFKDVLEKQSAEWERLKASFLAYMNLKGPVEYWRNSAMWHRAWAGVFGIVTILWGYFVGLKLAEYVAALLKDTTKSTSGAGNVPYEHLGEIGLVIFLLTLAIWLLRVLVRVTLSNLHLGTDAMARATMTKTYLALIQEKNALAEQDRILVLSTLFRPMTTGLIKDDGMPPSFTELLSRLIGGRTGGGN
jgi:hypothetical protein